MLLLMVCIQKKYEMVYIQRRLENMTLTLDQAFEQARSLKVSYKNS